MPIANSHAYPLKVLIANTVEHSIPVVVLECPGARYRRGMHGRARCAHGESSAVSLVGN